MVGNIPYEINLFVGREADEERLASSLVSDRLVMLTGSAGVGKSRLAMHTLHNMSGEAIAQLGEPCWADLAALPDGRLLAATVADAVGFADHTPALPDDAICEWLSDRRVLLVLDSCEHLVSDCRALVTKLMAACPYLTILATSRQPLQLRDEVRIDLEPLPHDSDALKLFFERAVTVAPALKKRSRGQIDDALRICRLVDGVPLAVELASAQVMNRTLRETADRLSTHFEDLKAPAPIWPRRHQTLWTAIGWSHELCDPRERLLWARLSVFRGPFDEASARAVCAGGPLSEAEVSTALAALIAKSVLTPSTPGRYRLLDTVREYGWMWLGELAERGPVVTQHASYFLSLARSADRGWAGPEQQGWYQKIAIEHANLCAALDRLMSHAPQQAVELAALVGFFWSCCGHLREARTYLEQALRLRVGSSAVLQRARWALGVAVLLQGEHDQAAQIGQQCARAAATSGDREEKLAAAYLLGITHLLRGEASNAHAVVEDLLGQAPGPAFASASTLRCHLVRVFALTGMGHLHAAAAQATALRAECVARGECWTRAYVDYQLALIALAQGRPADAADHARAMLEGKQRLGDSFGVALGLDLLAAAASARGAAETAALVSGAGRTFWRSVGHTQRGTPELRDVREQCWKQARAAMGDQAFEAAFRRGMDESPGSVLALEVAGRLSDEN